MYLIMRDLGRILLAAVLLWPIAGTAQSVTPIVWAKPDHFWFRKAVPGGNVWLTVDAVHGVKEPLFDHQRLAIELGVRGGGEFEPLTLPFADPGVQFVVKYDGSNAYIQEGALAIEFNLDGRFWRCDLQIKWNWNLVPPTDYECLPRGAARTAPVAAPPPITSPDRLYEAFIQTHNIAVRRSDGTGTPQVLTTDGVADFAYQPGSLRWLGDRKVTAYRVHSDVWMSNSLSGNVKKLIGRADVDVTR